MQKGDICCVVHIEFHLLSDMISGYR